jgi:hypothetical protein
VASDTLEHMFAPFHGSLRDHRGERRCILIDAGVAVMVIAVGRSELLRRAIGRLGLVQWRSPGGIETP